MTSGIYEIVNTINGKRYVGSAVDLDRRFREHRYNLTRGKHINRHLQSSWLKYGEQSFSFVVLELCSSKKLLIRREQRAINRMKPEFNVCLIAGSTLGKKHSPEALRKMAEKKKGKVISQASRDLISAALKDRVFSDETRRKITEALKAHYKKFPKKGNRGMTGKKHSEEARAKMRAARVGKIPARGFEWTEERHAAHAEWLKARARNSSGQFLGDAK